MRMYYQIPQRHGDKIVGYRCPIQPEIGFYFGGPRDLVPKGTLKGWWNKRDKIIRYSQGQRLQREVIICEFPELEEELYRLFCQA